MRRERAGDAARTRAGAGDTAHGTAHGHETDAAQFMPFAALSGHRELVREQARKREPRKEPTDERIEKISRTLMSLSKGDTVRITHYEHDAYVITTGVLRQVNEAFRMLELAGGRRILFEDLWELSVESTRQSGSEAEAATME